MSSRYLENQRHHREVRTQAYLDYLKSVSEQARLNNPEGSAEDDLLSAKTLDAKERICLYGSKEVIHAFAVFEKLGATISSDQQRTAFVAMVAAMRADSGNASTQDTQVDVEMVLMGRRDLTQ
jgi:hypothetical protein